MKRGIICLICVLCILLSGCGILPKEEEYEKAPLIPAYQKEQWEVAYVQRGDMVLSQTLSCTYMPVQTQTVSFDEADARFDELFVAVGDRVVAGQLLAQLDVSGLQEQMKECELQIGKLQLKIAAMEENLALALDRERILREGSTQQELEAALEKIQMQYDLQKQPLVDEAEILQMRLEDCRTKLQNRRLYAGIDGIVTFTRSVKKGDRIAAGEKLVVIEDSASSAFCADSRYWQYFQPGQEYTITVDDTQYLAQVVSETDIGLPETDKTNAIYALTYFQLKEQTPYLEDGDRGSVTLVLDSREDVLMIPESAVSNTKGNTVVYYQDEHGMKNHKIVEVGMAANGMIEVISGLTEGECIITG